MHLSYSSTKRHSSPLPRAQMTPSLAVDPVDDVYLGQVTGLLAEPDLGLADVSPEQIHDTVVV